MDHVLFIRSSVRGDLGCSHFGDCVECCWERGRADVCSGALLSALWGAPPDRERLDHVIIVDL